MNLLARTLDAQFRLVDKLVSLGIMDPAPAPTPEEVKKAAEKEAAALEKAREKQAKAEADAAAQGLPAPRAPRAPKKSYVSRIPSYVPDFKKAVSHICIHAGGRAVIDAIQAGLKLSEDDVAASRAMLKRYGNTSSSSVWYEFRHVEQVRKKQQQQQQQQ